MAVTARNHLATLALAITGLCFNLMFGTAPAPWQATGQQTIPAYARAVQNDSDLVCEENYSPLDEVDDSPLWQQSPLARLVGPAASSDPITLVAALQEQEVPVLPHLTFDNAPKHDPPVARP